MHDSCCSPVRREAFELCSRVRWRTGTVRLHLKPHVLKQHVTWFGMTSSRHKPRRLAPQPCSATSAFSRLAKSLTYSSERYFEHHTEREQRACVAHQTRQVITFGIFASFRAPSASRSQVFRCQLTQAVACRTN